MQTEITIALIGICGTIITSIGTLIGVIVTNRRSNREMMHKMELQQAVFEAHVKDQIGALTDEVRKYNNVKERTYKLETGQMVQQEKIASLENKIAEVKRRSG